MVLATYFIEEALLTSFKVLKVHYEPQAESIWTLQFEDGPPITYFDRFYGTTKADEQLVGRTIKAQIELNIIFEERVTRIANPSQQKASLYYDPSEYELVVTGLYMGHTQALPPNHQHLTVGSSIHSIFKVLVWEDLSAAPYHLNQGDWVRLRTGERCVRIARDHAPWDQ